jgi:hypothetical protein
VSASRKQMSIRTQMILSYLAQLRQSLGARHPILLDQLRNLYHAQDYAGMVKFVRDGMGLQLRVRVGLVNQGGLAGAPAWVSRPTPMPSYGTVEFRETLVTVFLRKSFLNESNFEKVVMAIAHELSHVVLDAVGHGLRECEEAVDLTAMLLGYRDVYVAGSEYLEVRPASAWESFRLSLRRRILGVQTRAFQSLGYLTPEEVRYAAIALGKPLDGFEAPRITNGSLLSGLIKLAFAAAGLAGVVWLSSIPQQRSPSLVTKPQLEEIPTIGTDNTFSRNQIRYCLSEKIRIEGARSALNQRRPKDVDRFNTMVEDYNGRCGSFRYRAENFETIRTEIKASRNRLLAEGVARF